MDICDTSMPITQAKSQMLSDSWVLHTTQSGNEKVPTNPPVIMHMSLDTSILELASVEWIPSKDL